MTFRMKVEDIFLIGRRTVFTGKLETNKKNIEGEPCILEIDGKKFVDLTIEGEVHTGKPHRDLWTTANLTLDSETIRNREVWLISV